MVKVEIKKGEYRGKIVSGVFQLIKVFTEGARGGYITIRVPDPKDGFPATRRINIEQENFRLVAEDGVTDLPATAILPGTVDSPTRGNTRVAGGRNAEPETDYEAEFMQLESDEEALERIKETFDMLEEITDGCAKGEIRGLVVTGPPGIGKSFGVHKKLQEVNLFRTIQDKEPNYEFITGGISPIGLYQKLYLNRQQEKVLVFDDCDEDVLFDPDCIILLKGALNSGGQRTLSWNKESKTLIAEGIPNSFEYEGAAIFLSNIDFDRSVRNNSRIASHLAAIMSRCHYLDLEISSTRDQLLRIKQMVRDGMLKSFGFTKKQEDDIVAFVVDNAEYLRETSLRMVKKIADLMVMDPTNWAKKAESLCLTKEAKFKRLLEKKRAAAAHGVLLIEK